MKSRCKNGASGLLRSSGKVEQDHERPLDHVIMRKVTKTKHNMINFFWISGKDQFSKKTSDSAQDGKVGISLYSILI